MKSNIIFLVFNLFIMHSFAQSIITIHHMDGNKQFYSMEGTKFVFLANNKFEIYEQNNVLSEVIPCKEVKKITFNDLPDKISNMIRTKSFRVYVLYDQLHIVSTKNNKTDIYIYDLTGKLLMSLFQSPDQSIYIGNINHGTYIIRINEHLAKFVK